MTLSNPFYLKTDTAKFEITSTYSENACIYDAICHRTALEETIKSLLQNVQSVDQELSICVYYTVICEGIPLTYVYSVLVDVKALDEMPYIDAAFEIGKVLNFRDFTS